MFFEEVYMRLSVSAAQSMTELRLQKKLCYSRYMKVKNFSILMERKVIIMSDIILPLPNDLPELPPLIQKHGHPETDSPGK